MTLKKAFFWVIGCLFMLVGLVGALLPVLPGWPFFFIGLSMIAPQYAIRLKRRMQRKFFKQDTVRLDEWKKSGAIAGFTTKHFPLLLKKTDELLDLSKQNQFKELLWKSHVMLEHEKASVSRFIFLNQVHGDNIVVLENGAATSPYEKEGFYHFPEADGVITNVPHLTLLVMTADCLPVFFNVRRRGTEDAHRRQWRTHWIGLVHAGWRGTQKQIVKKTFEMLRKNSDCPASDIHVAFGPCIGPRHYEVGEEFGAHFSGPSLRRKRKKLFFDLAAENKRQLIASGVRPSHVLDSKICTVSENRDFYSFRKEKDSAGRIISFITRL